MASTESALGFALSAVAAEHFFSAGMSSPWSVAKFAQSAEDQAQVMKLFWLGSAASLGFAVALALLLGNGGSTLLWSLAGTGVVVGFMYYEYQAALTGTL